jgi:hypothetical protein
MCDVPSIAVFCSESIECFPGTASKFFFKLLVTIPVAYYYYYCKVAVLQEAVFFYVTFSQIVPFPISSWMIHKLIVHKFSYTEHSLINYKQGFTS